KGGADHDTRIIARLRAAYRYLLHGALQNRKATILLSLGVLMLSVSLFPFLAKSFIPTLQEGAPPRPINRVASSSLGEAVAMEMDAMKAVSRVAGVKGVVSKLGRGESPADPAGQNESDPIVTVDPDSGRTQDEIDDEIRALLEVLPGVNIVL